ncbi:hypothetical protein IE53DRAFT_409218 [Violaceomyces palustris]|uniref:Uncharacterized protein n=1 Tax=Violaceomyces palustris TaxID=1673888 RepID=A0ACD0P3V5_9BASI|nr:hypothetical protein IE53DRAFT_409218 [Violaceomyces palustris]
MAVPSASPSNHGMLTPSSSYSSTSPADVSLAAAAAASKSTPRSAAAAAACAVASLASLPPEALLVCLIHNHPAVASRWSELLTSALEPIIKKFSTLRPGTRLLIATVTYSSVSAETRSSLLRPESAIVVEPFVPAPKFLDCARKKDWSRASETVLTLKNQSWDWLDVDSHLDQSLSLSSSSSQDRKALVVEGLVAALELLETHQGGATTADTVRESVDNPLLPATPSVLAKHILHISTADSIGPLDLDLRPTLTLLKHHDGCSLQDVCAMIGKEKVSLSSVGILGTESKLDVKPNAFETIHGLISSAGRLSVDDPSATLGSGSKALTLPRECKIMLSGFTEPQSEVPSSSAKKRPRGADDETEADGPTSGKRGKTSGPTNPQPEEGRGAAPPTRAGGLPVAVAAANLPGAPPAATNQPRIKPDQTMMNKVMFLQQQQAIMFRNLSIVASQVLKKNEGNNAGASNAAPGLQRQYLEQLRNQLIAQQQALKLQIQQVVSGAGPVPNFNMNLQSLVNIDKEAKEMGVNLGGPSGFQQGVQKAAAATAASLAAASSSVANGQSSASSTVPPFAASSISGGPAKAADLTLRATSIGPQPSVAGQGSVGSASATPSRPKPFWQGSISWSISDPATKQKRDIATVVVATSNASAEQKLLLPWPSRFQISAISQISPKDLQTYAANQSAPYVLFGVANGPEDGADRNLAMYRNLAGSLEAKKSCAFIRHGAPGCGIVLLGIQAASSSEKVAGSAAASPLKLIGIVFREPIPFAKLGSAQAALAPQATLAAAAAATSAPPKASSEESKSAVAPVVPTTAASGLLPAQSKALPVGVSGNMQQPLQNFLQAANFTPAPMTSLSMSNPMNASSVLAFQQQLQQQQQNLAVTSAPVQNEVLSSQLQQLWSTLHAQNQKPGAVGQPSLPFNNALLNQLQMAAAAGAAGGGGAGGISQPMASNSVPNHTPLLAPQQQGGGVVQPSGQPVAPLGNNFAAAGLNMTNLAQMLGLGNNNNSIPAAPQQQQQQPPLNLSNNAFTMPQPQASAPFNTANFINQLQANLQPQNPGQQQQPSLTMEQLKSMGFIQ